MEFPKKWRDGVDPLTLKFTKFKTTEILGFPHAGNDVFYVKGNYDGKEVNAFIKYNRQNGADVEREIDILNSIKLDNIPKVLDYDKEKTYRVTLALEGERLSTILGDNKNNESLKYMEEFGKMLAIIHNIKGNYPDVKDRKFFHIMDEKVFSNEGLDDLYKYLIENEPKEIEKCFCHGDFHYANVLWKDYHISGIIDFELSGIGNRDFDIAWCIINRPGQLFMNTQDEIDLFLKGYSECGKYNYNNIIYYMALIYSRFYFFGDDNYKKYIKDFFAKSVL